MVNIKINDVPISVEEGTTILEACREAKMIVPTLCYLKDINEIGACRVCVVEIKGIERLVTSCNNTVKEGMEIYTNSPKVRDARRINIKLILSQHNCFCPTCVRSGNCQLQKVANDLEFGSGTFKQHITEEKWPMDFPLIRDESKCIKCMRCIQICDKVQSLKVWDIAKTGSRTTVNVSLGRNIKEADCALCGQCITHCPVAALSGRDDKRPVFSQNGMLNTRRKTTVVQVAPAVRTAWAEAFKLSRKFASPERLAGALRLMGFDYVFDTTYAADLTIMEEGSEFLERLKHKEDYQWPMFTSCCPGWVRFLKSQYPDMVDCLSTAKSPQQMQGAIIKNYFADKIHEDHIRSIWNDNELYTIHQTVDFDKAKQELQGSNTGANFGENYIKAEAIITAALYAREKYKGSGSLDFYCTPHLLNVMLLARDLNGRRIYDSKADLAAALNVNSIITVEQFEGLQRTDSETNKHELLGLFVNLADYQFGSTKGGEVSKFDNFDIDFNQYKYLLETRLSGSLTKVYSAIALEENVA